MIKAMTPADSPKYCGHHLRMGKAKILVSVRLNMLYAIISFEFG